MQEPGMLNQSRADSTGVSNGILPCTASGRWRGLGRCCRLFPVSAWVALGTTAGDLNARTENYDEALAQTLPIPDVLDGRIANAQQWKDERRPELLKLFSDEVYGRTPQAKIPMRAEQRVAGTPVFGGKGIMRQTTLTLGAEDPLKVELLHFLPANKSERPVPMFVMLNFWGNHSVLADPAIPLSTAWFRANPKRGIVDHQATEAARGTNAGSFPIEAILARGYGLTTAYYGDIDPDFDDGFQNGAHRLFPAENRDSGHAWGSIGAWAWGLSRIADHLQQQPEVDAGKLAVLGHSRLGKAALWAGAQDERFGIVISNNSGEGGAALSKRNFGETVQRINTSFPHWFCARYRHYSSNEAELPMDQHALIALMAPRPVYIASATEDRWADPKGEFLGGKLAEPAYALFGKQGLGVDAQPPPDTPVGETIGYHLRSGAHDMLPYDWDRYLDFADRHWSREPETR